MGVARRAASAGLAQYDPRSASVANDEIHTVTISMRFGDFSRSTRAHSLPFPTDSTESILAAVRDLIDQSRPRIEEKELTLIGVSLGNLARADTVQMELPIGEQEERGGRDQAALDQAVDVVRSRFGDGVIKRASMIDADQGVPVPTLPDSDNSA